MKDSGKEDGFGRFLELKVKGEAVVPGGMETAWLVPGSRVKA